MSIAGSPPPLTHSPTVLRSRLGTTVGNLLLGGVWMLLAVAIGWLSFQDVGVANQLALAATAVTGLVLMQVCRLSRLLRLLFIAITTFMTLRYLAWRITDTLPGADTLSFIPGILLLFAELYGIAMYFFGVFVNIRPLEREIVALPDDETLLPTVDVFVPSYNEDEPLLETTLTAARQLRYPGAKLNVYLLDDGGTEQKRADRDPAKASAAHERHERLQALCARVGAHYLTRARNQHAKAGNINAALPRTAGELILILDADHVPTQDLLANTVGPFLRDPKLFLVQTPHFFVNPDPIERNLRTWERMPSENEMFYCVGQRGLDFWNASFFCGSAAVLRRRCLEEIGGLAGATITEDAETALELHARGYRSAYISRPMIAGLQPETFASFIGQRSRWAQGMMQIMLLKNPLLKRGLRLSQRIAYMSSCFYWLFPIARTLFLFMPLTYLFFGMKIYDASLEEFFAYAVAHLVCSYMLTNHMFGRVRWPFIGELYEMAQALFLLPAVLSVFVRPRAPTFRVTSKSETLARSYVSHLVSPVLWMFLLLLAGTAAGIWRYLNFPLEHDNLVIVFAWNLLNLVFMGAALGVVHERRQRRQVARTPRSLPAEVRIGGKTVAATVEDLSISGARIVLNADESIYGHFNTPEAELRLTLPESGVLADLRIQVRHAVVEDDAVVLGAMFTPGSQAERACVVELCYGSSAAWVDFQQARQGARTILGGLLFLIWLALARGSQALIATVHERTLGGERRPLFGGTRRIALQIGGDQ